MEQQQSFRSELVEWFKEIVPFSKLDLYIRKTREGYNGAPDAGRHDNHVSYIFCTTHHRYSISATPFYLGCIASNTFQYPGEDWTRGCDLPDGKFNRATWDAIKEAIIRNEMVKLAPKVAQRGVPESPVRCCRLDDDGDGNCVIHSAPGVLRNGVDVVELSNGK